MWTILTIRALTFKDGQSASGGGISITEGALVDLTLCIFRECGAISAFGGAINVEGSDTAVNVYGSRFIGNVEFSGHDIVRRGGTIIIHDTCPSPYEAVTPVQGKLRARNAAIQLP